ncbi:alpha-galactosidase [Paenibacillus phyllosphaerae]|uniref:Alpha-galactosidase n=1 Tax=Paenibacillus phyllosphaerae TaxID=274593 RepID=A0A7W5FM94_9BACL|nr:alpha-galactosidase [Paenibacillus phyllosphaerae]MBB3109827.1 alpha-galactosidase [Paenibacillus phyllosphaerae]
MPVIVNQEQLVFHLQSKSSSYAFQIIEGYPVHLYWGRKLKQADPKRLHQRIERCSFDPNPVPEDKTISLSTLQLEYPGYGSSDFRSPAYEVLLENGTSVAELSYRSYRIVSGKPELEGLPAVYAEQEEEAQTLYIELHDALTGLTVELSYTVFEAFDAIIRSSRLTNAGGQVIQLGRALSTSVDLPHHRFEMLQLSGNWTRERQIHRRTLVPGMQSVESRRGSSSHHQNPFFALLSEGSTEDHGEVYGFNLVYSGSFVGGVEVDHHSQARAFIGINPFDFSWRLQPGESFQTPEAVMVFSAEGLGGMSHTYHELYRTRLCRGAYRDAVRPILVNNWEATYFKFNAEKIEAIAKAGSELGIELFVLDDGWFGRRDSDNSSLGDWVVDLNKLPAGLPDLVERVRSHGMSFGLWFEPEMVSPDSDLYRAHPDWCLHVPGRRRTTGRDQLILDLSRKDVQDYIVESVSAILGSAPISYVKWDMNRNMTEIGSALLPPERQRETAHRYMLGLYDVMERITSAFPQVLFESCSGGGGRFDPGMLYYMPQTWTSDNSDAICRLSIQYGTSLVYPVSSMGAHVSAVPNHQVGRVTPLETRGDVAMSGNFGYELDLTKFTEEEKEEVKRQVALVKDVRELTLFGKFYRLLSPFEGNETAWMFVSPDQKDVLVVHVTVLAQPNAPLSKLRLKGLNPDLAYTELESGLVSGGDELMYAGVAVKLPHRDFASKVYRFRALES